MAYRILNDTRTRRDTKGEEAKTVTKSVQNWVKTCIFNCIKIQLSFDEMQTKFQP